MNHLLEAPLALAAGVFTVASPCILPVLPILFGSATGGACRNRPFMTMTGFIVTLTAFGLLLGAASSAVHIAQETLRNASLLAAALIGCSATAASAATHTTAPDFAGIEAWHNSAPLTMQQLRGKVVLVDFWTYTCINCIRTLPHVRDWYRKYKNQGLVVVSVHTPEFPFERRAGNVKKAIGRFDIAYPVAQDNRYATWNAYGNQYWPAVYLIDRQGKVVYTHFGEGAYARTEATIRALLAQK